MLAVVDKVLGRTGNTGNVTQVGLSCLSVTIRSASLSWIPPSVAL